MLKRSKRKKPELLAPVQDYMSLNAAINAGTDAVYFGIRGFNMRAGAKNFTIKDLPKISKIAKENKIRTFLALNTIVYEEEISKIEKTLKAVKKSKIDAVICWDLATIQMAKKLGIETHLSTQASVSNSKAAEFYKKLGIKRIVLARECSLKQIKKIKKNTKAEIEIFIHGAMCVSLSGRCFLSQFMHGKSANRGECLQPCRRKYLIKEKTNSNVGSRTPNIEKIRELEIGESYVLSPKDLCTIDFFEKLMETGAECFKIEGRNRSPEYVATVTAAYRKLIDFIFDASIKGKKFREELTQLKKETKKEVEKVYNRGFGNGFFLGQPINEWCNGYGNQASEKKIHVGIVTHYYPKISVAEILIQANKKIKKGDKLIFQGPKTGSFKQKIEFMEIEHKPVKQAKQGEKVAIKFTPPGGVNKTSRKNDQVYVIRKIK